MLKLNFNLETANERAEYVNAHMDTVGTYYTKKELDTIADYLLYGKEEDGESVVDKKLVQMKPKHNTYARKEPESLEALMEMPTFDERVFAGKTRYKTVKPAIDREKDADIPGMKELWHEIDKMDHILKVNKGEEPELEDEVVRKLSSREIYDYSHWIVELRRQQFMLKDAFKPTICRGKVGTKHCYAFIDEETPWDLEGSDYAIAPMGVYRSGKARFDDPRSLSEKDYEYNKEAKYVLDFRNPDHIYHLLENYNELIHGATGMQDNLTEQILETLDWYIEKSDLSDVQREIIKLKREKHNNEYIHDVLFQKFRVSHSTNYISTIYKQQTCGKIAETAQLRYDYYLEREHLSSWKKCSYCGEWKLKDTREYARKTRSADGLSTICKSCDKKKRLKRKEVDG